MVKVRGNVGALCSQTSYFQSVFTQQLFNYNKHNNIETQSENTAYTGTPRSITFRKISKSGAVQPDVRF